MGEDDVTLLGSHLSVFQGPPHSFDSPISRRLRSGDVVGVGGESPSGHLGIDAGTPPPGVRLRLQDHGDRPLPHDEAIPVPVEGAAGPLRLLIPTGEGPGVGQAGYDHWSDKGIRRPGNDGLCLASAQDVHGFQESLGAAGAGGRGGDHRPLGTGVDGDRAGHSVGHDIGHNEGADPLWPPLVQDARGSLQLTDSPTAGVDDHAHVFRVRPIHGEPSIGQGHAGSGQGEVGRTMGTSGLLEVHVVPGVKALDLGGDAHGEACGVELSDRPHSRDARRQVGPKLFHAQSDGRDGPQASDHNAMHRTSLLRHWYSAIACTSVVVMIRSFSNMVHFNPRYSLCQMSSVSSASLRS